MPTTAAADRASTALEELSEALKNPAAAKPFLNTGNKLNAAIEALTEILSKRSTDAPKSEEKASPPRVSKRTTTVRTPKMNTAQAGSPLVKNDPKLALQPKISPQVPVRGLNKITSMRAHPTLNATNNIINDDNNNSNEENSEANSDETNPNRRQLRKIIIPKTQKLKLNTTVYKIFEDKIHTGYICKFDLKDGFYKIKYQDGDIEEGTEEEISRLLKKPNQTAWKQALYQLLYLKEHMPSTVKQRRKCRYDHIF
jgi:hypothetical protein